MCRLHIVETLPHMFLTVSLRSGIIVISIIFMVEVYEESVVETTGYFSPVEADASD